MSTLAEIMAAVDALPKSDQRKVYSRLSRTLAAGTRRKPLSLHDRMKDLGGSVESGAGNLSDKKKYSKPRQGKKAKPSLYELMKDACGIVDSGIRDLSNKKKHLRLMGYGKSRVTP